MQGGGKMWYAPAGLQPKPDIARLDMTDQAVGASLGAFGLWIKSLGAIYISCTRVGLFETLSFCLKIDDAARACQPRRMKS